MLTSHRSVGDSNAQSNEPIDDAFKQPGDGKKSGYCGRSSCCTLALALTCLVSEIVIFLFVVIGTPTDAFHWNHKDNRLNLCYSMWGNKACGDQAGNNPLKAPNNGFPSEKIGQIMKAASAFSIISIFFTLVTCILTATLLCTRISSVVPFVFSIVSFITTLIVWACQAGAYHKKYLDTTTLAFTKISKDYRLDVSFALFVTAWCLQTIEMVLVLFA